jgi:hypothetical protein
MFWLLTRVVVWPVKAVTGTAKLGTKATAGSFKAGYRTGSLLGYRRVGLVAVGVGVGLLVAPRPGRELRDQLRQRLIERGLLSPPGATEVPSVPEGPSPLPDVDAARRFGNGAPDATGSAGAMAADPAAGSATELAADVAAGRPVEPAAEEPRSNGPA